MSATDVIYTVLVSLAGALVFNTLVNVDVCKVARARRRLRQLRRVRTQRAALIDDEAHRQRKAREAELRLPQLHRERVELEAKITNALRNYTGTEFIYRAQLSHVLAEILEAEGWLRAV